MDKLYSFSRFRQPAGVRIQGSIEIPNKQDIQELNPQRNINLLSAIPSFPNRKITTRCCLVFCRYLPFRSRFSDQCQFESYCPLVLARLAPASATNTTITSSHSPVRQINSTNRTTRILNPGKGK